LADQHQPTPADLADFGLTSADAETLLDIAEAAVRARLEGRSAPLPDDSALPPALHRGGTGAFVTLQVAGRLNGCIGDLGGGRPLAESIAELAVKSAFHDPRLPQLRTADLDDLAIEISLLSARSAVRARTRTELVEQLLPGVHGLVLTSGGHSALFLPSVWEQLPRPDDFIDRLLLKAGLAPETWPTDLLAEVFTCAEFERSVG
jgi:AmmeMemoRadiSam system protein A